MEIETGEFYKGEDLKKIIEKDMVMDFDKSVKEKELEVALKEKGFVSFVVGEEFEIKGGRFKLVYVNVGKNRITLQGIPKK